MARRKEISARYPKRDLFLSDFMRDGPLGVIFVETGRKLELSEPVTVIVDFPAERRYFRIKGRIVARRRASVEPPLAPGVQVEIPGEESKTLQMILDHAAGKDVEFTDRSTRRMPCSFEISYRHDRDLVQEFAEDISEGGTFIRTERIYPVGTEVECKLKPPGYLVGIKMRGRVAWVAETGEPRGMGIEFKFESARQKRRLQELLRKLAADRDREVKRKMENLRRGDRFR